MDKTLTALQARYHGMQWTPNPSGLAELLDSGSWLGTAGNVRIGLAHYTDGWAATGRIHPDETTYSVWSAESADVALDRLAAMHPDFAAALAPAEPELRTVQAHPDMMAPGPAGLGCPALAALMGLVGVGFCLLWLGVEVVRWLTGGAS